MPVFARLRKTRRSPAVIDFLRHDKALPDFITFTRADATPCATRRRINGSVGPSRTNTALRSQEFDNAAWTKLDASITPNATTAPDGTVTADKLVEAATTAFHRVQGVAIPSGTLSTISVYAKAAERSALTLNFAGYVSGAAVFNLSTGALGLVQGGVTATIEPANNGFYRCSITGTPNVLATTDILVNNVTNSVATYAGDGVSGVYVWGAQVEIGAQATPYIPTTTAPVTTTDWPRTNHIDTFGAEFQDSRTGWTLDNTNGLVGERVQTDLPRGGFGVVTRYTLPSGYQIRFGNIVGTGVVGMPRVASAWLRKLSGDAVIVYDLNDLGMTAIADTDEWQYLSVGVTHPTQPYFFLDIYNGNAGPVTFEVCEVLLEDDYFGTGVPGAYFSGTTNTPPYGDLEVLAANKPRIEYNTDGTARGLLIEPSRQNLYRDTVDLSAVHWSFANLSRAQGYFGPLGQKASLITTVAGVSNFITPAGYTITPAAGTMHLRALKVKSIAGAGTNRKVFFEYPGFGKVDFDLNALTATLTSGATGTVGVSPLEDGWYLCWHLFTMVASVNVGAFYFDAYGSGAVGGVQMLVCDPVLTPSATSKDESYIANTTAATLTRAAESAIITDLASINWNPNGWTGYVEWEHSTSADAPGNARLFELGDDGFFVLYQENGTAAIKAAIQVYGVWQDNIYCGDVTLGGVNKVAFHLTSLRFAVSVNGAAPVVTSPLSGILTVTYTKASFLSNNTGADTLPGYLRRFKGWDRVLSLGELQALTV